MISSLDFQNHQGSGNRSTPTDPPDNNRLAEPLDGGALTKKLVVMLTGTSVKNRPFKSRYFLMLGFVESDKSAVECLKKNLKNACLIETKDFTRLKLNCDEALFCDPPRSGLGKLIDEVHLARPPFIAYISCDFDSWNRDVQLLSKDYRATRAILVDQFPHTPRMEIISFFERV